VLSPREERRREHSRELVSEIAARRERRAAHEGEWAGTRRVAGHHRQPAANVVERVDEGDGTGAQAASARNAGRSDEHEPPDSRRLSCRELRREEPAEGVTGDVGTLEACCIEPAGEPGAHLGEAECLPGPRQIDDVEPPTCRQRLDDG
jgi:hypothetical protein